MRYSANRKIELDKRKIDKRKRTSKLILGASFYLGKTRLYLFLLHSCDLPIWFGLCSTFSCQPLLSLLLGRINKRFYPSCDPVKPVGGRFCCLERIGRNAPKGGRMPYRREMQKHLKPVSEWAHSHLYQRLND